MIGTSTIYSARQPNNNQSLIIVNSVILTDSLVPVKRPHFRIEDHQLFFLISRRPAMCLDDTDVELWGQIDGSKSVGFLKERFKDAESRVTRLWGAGVIELVRADFPTKRRKILVIEPHMDDAVLSIGGWMLKHCEKSEFTVVSFVGVSNFTSYQKVGREYYDTAGISELRRTESELVMRAVGGRHRCLDFHDCPLRMHPQRWSAEWYQQHRRAVAAYINHSPSEQDRRLWTAGIKEVIEEEGAEEIWFPLGIGTSTDHQLAREASLNALSELDVLGRGIKVVAYEDVPYSSKYPQHGAAIVKALENQGASLSKIVHDVSEVFADKLRLISVFGSQFKPEYMDPRVRASAALASCGDGYLGEVHYEVSCIPSRFRFEEMWFGSDRVERLSKRLSLWYPRNRSARRIRILCPIGVGFWLQEMGYLLEKFPDSLIEVYLTEDALAESKSLVSEQLKVIPVRGMAVGWIKRLLVCAITPRVPTITLTSYRLELPEFTLEFARLIANWILVANMDQLVRALHSALDHRDLNHDA